MVVEDTIIVLGGEGNNPRWSGEILKSKLQFCEKNCPISCSHSVEIYCIVPGGTQFRLKNNGRGTCAVPYEGGFVQIGGGKVDRLNVAVIKKF